MTERFEAVVLTGSHHVRLASDRGATRAASPHEADRKSALPSRTLHSFWSAFVLLVPLLMFTILTANPTAAAAATGPVTLQGTTPQQVLSGAAKNIGPDDPSQTLRLIVGLQPPDMAGEEQFLHDVQTPGSKVFQQFLTADQWNSRFAPSTNSEQAVVDWAQNAGLTVTYQYNNRLLVDLQGTVGTIEKTFGVTINSYSFDSATYFSNDRDLSIPGDLEGIVQTVIGTNDFNQMAPAISHASTTTPHGPMFAAGPAEGTGKTVTGNGNPKMRPSVGKINRTQHHAQRSELTSGLIDPPSLWNSQAYDFNALFSVSHCCNPTNVSGGSPPQTSIAITTSGSFDPNDLRTFAAQYGLGYLVTDISIDGWLACCNDETTLDVEYATAMSNDFGDSQHTAHIYVYDAWQPLFLVDAMNHALNDGYARSWSTSWGGAESAYVFGTWALYHNVLNNMAGLGWTMTAATGDNGAYQDCNNLSVNYPASDPNVVAAGGTALTLNGDGTFTSETSWGGTGCQSCPPDNTNCGGGGGGCSTIFHAPPYQLDRGMDNGCGGYRSLPDVSLNASPNNAFYYTHTSGGGGWLGVGGTSIVAPELVGLFAQLDSYRMTLGAVCSAGPFGFANCGSAGAINYAIYDEATGHTARHSPFYDVTTGCNGGGPGIGFCAGTGYDLATGWGSFNALQLVRAINRFDIPDSHGPAVAFSGPTTGEWYNTDQTVSWTVADSPTGGDPVASGLTGFSYDWDFDPGDPTSDPTPGAGDSFYVGPRILNMTADSASLAHAGQGCHTLNVQAWDNTGNDIGDQTYGPLCYDTVAPTTDAHLSGTLSGSVFTSAVQVTLNASDPDPGSGIANTTYTINCTAGRICTPYTYSHPFTINHNGHYTIGYYSIDNAGNAESVNSISFDVNITPTATTQSAELIGPSWATLSGVVDLRGLPQGCAWLVYGTSSADTQTAAQTTVTASGSITISATIKNLAPGTVYRVNHVAVVPGACGAPEGSEVDGTDQPFLTKMTLTPGWNFVALPTTQYATRASALATNLNTALSGHLGALAVLRNSRFQLFVPGYSRDFTLRYGEGIAVLSGATSTVAWTIPGDMLTVPQNVTLTPGWNLVAPAWQASTESRICSATGATQIASYSAGTYTSYMCGSSGTGATIANAQSVMLLAPAARIWTMS